jgi:hypothetical protein
MIRRGNLESGEAGKMDRDGQLSRLAERAKAGRGIWLVGGDGMWELGSAGPRVATSWDYSRYWHRYDGEGREEFLARVEKEATAEARMRKKVIWHWEPDRKV